MSQDNENDRELILYNRKLKKAILDVLFREVDTFFIHCRPNPRLVIGKRGLHDKEETEGIILVFGPQSVKDLGWDDEFIYADMQFNAWEHVSIPYECITRIFDKSGQVLMQWASMASPDESADKKDAHEEKPGEKNGDIMRAKREFGSGDRKKERKLDGKDEESRVIEVDFRKKGDKE